jgi:general secretion pathway protein D
MQERQEFLDRYFVFGDSEWEPPRDFSRANGLVEDIRQSIIKEADRARIEEEAKPKGPRTHEPGQPIALPSMAAKGGGGGSFGGGASFGNNDDGAAPPPPAPVPGGAPAPPRRVRAPGTPPRPPATRVE